MTRLNGKIALITGGTAGIGQACALKLAQHGADVIISGRNREKGMQIVSAIEEMGRRAAFQDCNLWEYDSVKEMADRAIATMGKVDILVANGGATPEYAKFFHELSPEDYARGLNTQQFARLYIIRALLDHMKELNYAKIVVLTSDAGRVATPRESIIGSAAAGLIQMTKVMASEFSRWQIRINAVATTIIEDTPAFNGVMATPARHVFQKAYERARFGIPTAEDVAGAVLFLASPESDMVTGQILSVNGGLSFPG